MSSFSKKIWDFGESFSYSVPNTTVVSDNKQDSRLKCGRCRQCHFITADCFPIGKEDLPPALGPFAQYTYAKKSLGGMEISMSGAKGFQLHKDVNSLIESAKNGCDLCRILWQAIIYNCPSTDAEQEIRAAYGQVCVYFFPQHVSVRLGREAGAEIHCGKLSEYSLFTKEVMRGGLSTHPGPTWTAGHLRRFKKEKSQKHIRYPIDSQAGSDSVLSLAAAWLSECSQHHTCYKTGQSPSLPTRVLDVGIKQSDTVRIMPGSGIKSEYLVLSYCWGDGPHYHKLKKEAIHHGMLTMPLNVLPNTIKDAVHITRFLGFRYLWVDALCIIQDDEHDWQVESSKMSEVYSNAYCTLSASGAKNTSEGCFLKRSGSALPLQPGILYQTDSSKQMSELALIPSVPQWEVAVRNAPLNYRLWALQERALSHRIMHWTKNELFWECGEGYASESYPSGLPLSSECHSKHDAAQPVSEAPAAFQEIVNNLPSEDAVLRQWYLIAMEASRRSLTESSDMLPALSGLAHIIHQRTKDQYLAGLWRRDLPRSLFWRRGDGWPPKKSLQSYRAPSWSWASVVDSVVFPGFGDHALHDFAPDITLVEENVQLVGVDPFGQVRSGYIRVSGWLSQLLTRQDSFDTAVCAEGYNKTVLSLSSLLPERFDCHEGEVTCDIIPEAHEYSGIVCLRAYQLTSTEGTPLVKAIALSPVEGKPDYYRRVGWVDKCGDNLKFVYKTISII